MAEKGRFRNGIVKADPTLEAEPHEYRRHARERPAPGTEHPLREEEPERGELDVREGEPHQEHSQ